MSKGYLLIIFTCVCVCLLAELYCRYTYNVRTHLGKKFIELVGFGWDFQRAFAKILRLGGGKRCRDVQNVVGWWNDELSI